MKAVSGMRGVRAAIYAAAMVAAVMLLGRAQAQVATTNVQGTLYRADGTAATGTLLVSWPTFTTALNQSVAAGSVSETIGSNGFVSLNLAPNAGASPAGTYYTAVYHLSDGTVSREYWVVPQATTASISSVRAQLAPATIAIQPVTKSYVDASIAAISGNYVPLAGGTMSGPLQLSGDPVSPNQAATKHYADALAAAELPLAGGSLSGTLNTPNAASKLPRVDVRHPDFGTASGCSNAADPTGQQDSTCAIQAAITWAENNKQGGNYPPVYFAPGNYKISGNISDNGSIMYFADGATLSIASGKTVSLGGYGYSGTAALPNQIGTVLQAQSVGVLAANPAQATRVGTYSADWQSTLFNGRHSWTGSGWYGEDFMPQNISMEDDQPGLDWASPSFGSGGHSEFYPYYYYAISRSPAFLEYGMSWQQNSISDSGQYDTGYCQGGIVNSDDEGCFHLNFNGGELSTAYTGTVTSTGTNSVMTSCTGGCPTYNASTNTYSGGDQGDLRYLIITSSQFASGHIESTTNPSGLIPGTVTVDTTVPVSTAWGTLQANCGPASPANPIGIQTTAVSCSVNLNDISSFGNSPGSFTTTGIVCFSGQFHECAFPTSVGTASGGVQTVSFNLLYPHQSGSVVMQGGAADTYLDLLVNRGTVNTSGAGTLKYPIDVIGSINSNTLVDVEFFKANNGLTVSIGDGTITGNLMLGKWGFAANLSNTGGVVTLSTNNGTQGYPAMNGQNVYIYGATDSTFNGACTNFQWNSVAETATCNQSSSTGHTATSASIALNCTSTNASCTANQYGNGDFVLWEGAQVLDVQDPNSSPANAIDGYFLLEPNPWTWTSATVEEPHHYAAEFAERKGLIGVANPMAGVAGVTVSVKGTGAITPFANYTYGSAAGEYDSSGLFGGSNTNSPSFYSYYGGTSVPPNAFGMTGQYYDLLSSQYAPNWGGSVLWIGCPESYNSKGGCGDASYQYNLFHLEGGASATYVPNTNTLTFNGNYAFGSAVGMTGITLPGGSVSMLTSGQSGCGIGSSAFCVTTYGSSHGVLSTYNNKLDDGNGNATFAGSVTMGTSKPTQISLASGHTFTRHTIVTASLTPASVAAYACVSQSMTVTGLNAGDHVINRDVVPSFVNNLMLNGIIVTGANTVSMYWCNDGGAALAPPSGTYTFDVEQ